MALDGNGVRVLWVTEEVPDHDGGGGSMRLAFLFHALAAAISTDLLLVGTLTDERIREVAGAVTELPKRNPLWSERVAVRRALQLAVAIGSPGPAQAYFSGPGRRTLARALRRLDVEYDLVIVEHGALAPIIPRRRNVPWVIDFQHLFSRMAKQQEGTAQSPHQRWLMALEQRKARALERRAVRRFDRLLACSEEDAAALRGAAGEADGRVVVIPNGVDLSRFSVSPLPAEPRILLPGTLGYLPNVDGALWFASEVFPRIRDAAPGASLEIVGRSPTPEIRELAATPGISVEADVPSMAPYFESARVVVVPLRVGTGTRLKALEAMAAARPVVGTSIGLEGLGIVDRTHARIVDEAEPMAAVIAELLIDDRAARPLADAGRAHVEHHYGWEQIGTQMIAVVSDLLDRGIAR